jgi:hypothetical protein
MPGGEASEMQTLSIEATSSKSARRLFAVLSRFDPRWSTDEVGRYFVSVQLGSDKHQAAVLDTIDRHRLACAESDPVRSLTVSVDEPRYSIHDR